MLQNAIIGVDAAAELLGRSSGWIRAKAAAGEMGSDVAFKLGLYWSFDPEKLLEWAKSGASARAVGRPKKVRKIGKEN